MSPIKDNYKALVENMPDAFVYLQTVPGEKGDPADYIFMEVNPAFEEMTGRGRDQVIGSRITTLFPGLQGTVFEWVLTYGPAVSSGKTVRLQQYVKSLDRWHAITAFSYEPGFFAAVFRDITATKRLEQDLVRKEALYQAAPISRIGGWEYEVASRRLIWTGGLCSLLGVANHYPLDRLEKILGFFSPPWRHILTEALQQALAGGEGYDLEAELVSARGEKKWVRTTAKAILQEGRAVRLIGHIVDISEKKLANESLKESEKEFHSVFELAAVGIVQVNPENGQMIRYNEKYREITGYSDAELAAAKFPELTHPADRAKDWDIFTRARRGETPYYRNEKRYIRKDGSTVWVRLNAAFIRDPAGRAVRTICVCEDINDRRMAEEQVFRQNQILRGIIDYSSFLIYAKDRAGRFITASRSLAKIYGRHSEADLIGKTSHDFLSSEEADQRRKHDLLVMEKQRQISREEKVETPAGELSFLTIKFPLFDSAGAMRGICGISVDITGRKKSELALKKQLQFEKMLSELSAGFVSLPAERLSDGIDHALRELGLHFQADRSYLLRLSADGKTLTCTHEWCKDGVTGHKERMQAVPSSSFPCLDRRIFTADYISIEDIGALPPEAAAEKQECKRQGIRSLLWVPIRIESAIFGILCLDTQKSRRRWSEGLINRARTVSNLIAGALIRHRADWRIRYMSFHDQLTGLYNRSYLEEEFRRLDTERQWPLAVIMADINGLKLVKDTFGHSRGDELIRAAALRLRRSCRREDIIARWGGDEFMVLLPQTGEGEAEAVCARIAEGAGHGEPNGFPLSIATGLAVKKRRGQRIAELLTEAEERMYRHKLAESSKTGNQLLRFMLETLAKKSHESVDHVRHMRRTVRLIAAKMNLSAEERARLERLVILHDIGMIGLGEEVLTKAGPLTEEEWQVIRAHPAIGRRIALAIGEHADLAEDIYAHHENWDGSGYPRGLKGRSIPLGARILAAAGAYEGMSRGRVYRKAMSKHEIDAELKRCSGKQLDPTLVEIVLEILAETP